MRRASDLPGATISMTHAMLGGVREHLFRAESECEEAGFLLARVRAKEERPVLMCMDWLPIPAEGFTSRSAWYLELTDAMRARVIKLAHDRDAALIEVHSHPAQRRACFSWSDLHGFEEFVPHVMWRLPHRPYAAVVMASNSFDGLVWADPQTPLQVTDLVTGDAVAMRATGLTLTNWDEICERSAI